MLGATNPALPFWRNGRVFPSSVDAAVRLVAEADQHHGADGVYLRANVINPSCIAQWGTDIWMPSRTGQGTGNVNIVCRRYVLRGLRSRAR